jgi:iron complex transport system substrate-binding protein
MREKHLAPQTELKFQTSIPPHTDKLQINSIFQLQNNLAFGICKLGFIWFLLFGICLFLGCEGKRTDAKPAYLKITDDLNREVVFQSKPKRIISLAPSITETLFALDGGKSLIAVTDYCDYPKEAKIKTSIGGMVTPNFEKIAELNPDLIIISVEGNNQADFNKLQNLGYKMFVTKPKDIQGVLKSISDIGKIIGADSSADALTRSMRKRLDKVIDSNCGLKKNKILTIISLQPLICAGNYTFINELVKIVGGINIAANAPIPYPILGREEVLKQNPDLIIAMDDAVKDVDEILRYFPEWKNLKAFKEKKVFIVDGDILSRPGPRIIDGLELLESIVRSRNSVDN